jgi:type I restriction enzyme S subunit
MAIEVVTPDTARLPALPPGWAWATVAEIGQIQGGIQKQPSRAPRANAFPFLRVANVLRGRLDLADVHRIELFSDELSRLRLRAGDLLVVEGNGSPGEIGRMAIWNGAIENCVHQNHIIRIRLPDALDARFIEYFWNSPVGGDAVRGVASSTSGLYTLSVSKLGRLRVPIAPAAAQRRIVAEIERQFTRLDAAVASLQRARASLKRYRAAVLRAACEGRLVPTEAELARAEGREYEPAHLLLERILDERRESSAQALKHADQPDTSVLGELPEGWHWARVDQLCIVQGGIQKQPKRAPRQNYFPFLRVANVLRGRLDLEEVHSIELFGNELEKLRLQPGDLLIVEGNGSPTEIGRMAIWRGEIADCVHQNHIIRVRPAGCLEPRFIETYWNSPRGSDAVMRVASSTSGLYTLSVAKVSRLPIPLPPLTEQRRIVAEVERRLSVVDEMEATVAASLRRAERLRQTILKRAFAGKLVPQDPSDEPASALLARIQAERDGATPQRRGRPAGRGARGGRQPRLL